MGRWLAGGRDVSCLIAGAVFRSAWATIVTSRDSETVQRHRVAGGNLRRCSPTDVGSRILVEPVFVLSDPDRVSVLWSWLREAVIGCGLGRRCAVCALQDRSKRSVALCDETSPLAGSRGLA